jgi:YHS domain-containing protein
MIIKIIVVALFLYFLYRMSRRFLPSSPKKVKPLSGNQNLPRRAEDLVEDPYCHTYLPMSEAFSWEERGKTLYFCSRGCLEAYRQTKKGPSKEE